MDKDIKYILNHPKYSNIIKRAIFNPIKEDILSDARDRLFTDFLNILEKEFYQPLLRYFSTGKEEYLPEKNLYGVSLVRIIDALEDSTSSYEYDSIEDSYENDNMRDQPPHKKFDYEINIISEILNKINYLKKEGLSDVIYVEKDIFKDSIANSIEKRINKNKDEYFEKCKFIKKEYGCDNFDATEFAKGTIRLRLKELEDTRVGAYYLDRYQDIKQKTDSYIIVNNKHFLSYFFNYIITNPISEIRFSEVINLTFSRFSGTVFHELYHFCQLYLLKYGIKFGFSKMRKEKDTKRERSKDIIEERSFESEDSDVLGYKQKLEKNININKETYYIYLKIKEDITSDLDPYEASLPIILKSKKDFEEIKSKAIDQGYYDLSDKVSIKIGNRYREVKYNAFMFDERIYVHFDMVESSPGKFTIKEYGEEKIDYQNIPVEKYPGVISYMSDVLGKLAYYIFNNQYSIEKIFEEDYLEENKEVLERMLSGVYSIEKQFKDLEDNKKERVKKYLKNFLMNSFPRHYINWFELSDNSIINQFWSEPMMRGVLSRSKYLDPDLIDAWLEENYNKVSLNPKFFTNLIGNLSFSIFDLEYDFSDLIHKNISRFMQEYGSDILKSSILKKIISGYKNEKEAAEHSLEKQNAIINKILNVGSLKVDDESFKKIDDVLNSQAYDVDTKTIFEVIKKIKPNEFFQFNLDDKYNKRFPKLTLLMLENINKDDFQRLGLEEKYSEKNLSSVFTKNNTEDEFIENIIKAVKRKSKPKQKRRSRIFKSWNK